MITFLKPGSIRQEDTSSKPFTFNPGLLRLIKDKEELEIPNNMKIDWTDKEDLSKFTITVTPQESSLWRGGSYLFSAYVTPEYPHEPPKFECLTKVLFEFLIFFLKKCEFWGFYIGKKEDYGYLYI